MIPSPEGSLSAPISIAQVMACLPARRRLFGAFSNRLKTNLQEQIHLVDESVLKKELPGVDKTHLFVEF
jgi:hypothetical protein